MVWTPTPGRFLRACVGALFKRDFHVRGRKPLPQ